jgi:hypothetical protein
VAPFHKVAHHHEIRPSFAAGRSIAVDDGIGGDSIWHVAVIP